MPWGRSPIAIPCTAWPNLGVPQQGDRRIVGGVRLLHASDCYQPRTGGIETHLHDLARAQTEAGHEVHILTVETGPGGEGGGLVEDDNGVTVHRLGIRMPFNAPFNPMAGPRAARIIEELEPDVIHVHAGIVCPFALGVAKEAMARGLPVAITWHSMLDRSRPVLKHWAALTGWAAAPAALSAVSRVAAAEVARVYGAGVNVLHDGIDQGFWSPGVTDANPAPPLRCVTTARLVPKKGLAALVGAFAEAVDDLPRGSLSLDIFGDGPDRWRIEQAIRQRRLEGVVATRGKATKWELLDAYRRSHVFCAPARREAFGIAGLEARSTGLVLLGRRGNGLDEFVEPGVDSVLVDDTREMSRALVRLVSDPSWFGMLRANARAGAPGFDYDMIVEQTMDEYRRAMAIRAGAVTGTS